jgi:hypothetical protein
MTSGFDGDPRRKLVYDEAVRGWSLQSSVLDELRSRTGVLLAAASVAAALLGSADLEKHQEFTVIGLFALGAFILVVLGCLWVLWPKGDWTFSHDARSTLDAYLGDDSGLNDMYENLAIKTEEYRDENDRKLSTQFCAFRVASFALGASIVLWLIDLN